MTAEAAQAPALPEALPATPSDNRADHARQAADLLTDTGQDAAEEPAGRRPAAPLPGDRAARRAPARDRAARPTLPPRLLIAAQAVCLLGALLLGFPAYVLGIGTLREARDQDTRYAMFRHDLVNATAPVGGAIPEGTSVAVLAVPRLGMREVVVEGTAAGLLMSGPGHRRGTVLPGQAGISVVAGRRTGFGAPFQTLASLHAGDAITTTTGQGTATYTVLVLQRSGVRTQPVGLPADRLVLVTSDPAWQPDRALVVVAGLQTPAVAGGPARVALRPEERTLVGDSSALVPLVLWGQLLLLALAGTAWLYSRWGRWPAWLVTTPVVLAVLANCYEQLARLLPNTY